MRCGNTTENDILLANIIQAFVNSYDLGCVHSQACPFVVIHKLYFCTGKSRTCSYFSTLAETDSTGLTSILGFPLTHPSTVLGIHYYSPFVSIRIRMAVPGHADPGINVTSVLKQEKNSLRMRKDHRRSYISIA